MDPTKIYKAAAKNDTAFLEQITSNEMKSYLQDSENILKPITDNEDSILHVATKFRRMRFAEKLISLDQSLIYLGNKKGDTPLHVAASIGCGNITKLLIDRSSSNILETVNIDKDTALHLAMRNAQHSIVELLIRHKPELAMMVNEVGESALFLAVDKNNYHTAKYILDSVPESIRCRGRDRMNVLHVAIIRMVTNRQSFYTKKDYNVADFLSEVIKKEPNLASEADDFGWTPLHYAAHYGSVQVMKLLLKYAGSSAAYIKDKEGMSALHIAAEQGHLMVVTKVVSEFPSTYELLDNKGRTPLHVAAESGKSFWTLLFLIRNVPDDLINKQDSSGNTMLHLAAVHKRLKKLAALAADKRFDKGVINKEGLSCLEIYKSSTMTSLFFKLFIPMFEAFGYLPSLQAAFPRRTIKVQTTGTSEPQIESRNTSKQKENDSSINGKTEQGADSSFVKEKANVDLLVATFVATVTFAAIFTMPYREDGATSGQKLAFGTFAIANSISFVLSTASMFLHFYAFGMKEEIPDAFPGFLTWSEQLIPCAVHALVVAYSTGSYGVMARSYPKIASWAFGLGFVFFIGPLFAVIKTVHLMAT
ncbi:ankyrin repeat-containing protein At5g02620-like [Juglans microcarpa x Juglans regia]|uniref:ankyrin repeat-containing protein At5g02620-like n=1 Tax=Juglans microcarpa x Juglans regia TaxID=2249226 RepID=UPI001B7EC127|nr:ankyrin repeat-containing protein At5g02620-like [Juglans microcarpa x Juglans regia]